MIWAVVLAAGESRRMGEPKLLLPFRGRTIIEDVIAAAVRSPVDRTLVVLGAHADRIGALLGAYPVERAFNPDYRAGMLSSVQCGIRHLPPDARAALFFLGDQPGVSAASIAAVMKAYLATGKGLVLPVCGGAGGHPLLVDMKYRTEIEGLDPGVGLKGLLSLHPGDVERIEAGDGEFPPDIDTPDEYRRAVSGASGASKKSFE
jgi:molybdenum cofactor cytidylyltransferase